MMENDYDNMPVSYCKRCLSLKILNIKPDGCYCEQCGNTDIGETSIQQWQEMYKATYGESFLDYINPDYVNWEGRKHKIRN